MAKAIAEKETGYTEPSTTIIVDKDIAKNFNVGELSNLKVSGKVVGVSQCTEWKKDKEIPTGKYRIELRGVQVHEVEINQAKKTMDYLKGKNTMKEGE